MKNFILIISLFLLLINVSFAQVYNSMKVEKNIIKNISGINLLDDNIFKITELPSDNSLDIEYQSDFYSTINKKNINGQEITMPVDNYCLYLFSFDGKLNGEKQCINYDQIITKKVNKLDLDSGKMLPEDTQVYSFNLSKIDINKYYLGIGENDNTSINNEVNSNSILSSTTTQNNNTNNLNSTNINNSNNNIDNNRINSVDNNTNTLSNIKSISNDSNNSSNGSGSLSGTGSEIVKDFQGKSNGSENYLLFLLLGLIISLGYYYASKGNGLRQN